jgi:hypothetical protein
MATDQIHVTDCMSGLQLLEYSLENGPCVLLCSSCLLGVSGEFWSPSAGKACSIYSGVWQECCLKPPFTSMEMLKSYQLCSRQLGISSRWVLRTIRRSCWASPVRFIASICTLPVQAWISWLRDSFGKLFPSTTGRLS